MQPTTSNALVKIIWLESGVDARMKRKTRVSFGFCLLVSMMILTLPSSWLFAAVCAAAVHEGFHILAIRMCGGRSLLGELCAWNAGIPLPYLGRWKELICALAGPAGGLLLLALLPVWPEIALCGCLQSLYNLLPIYPLDGGRAMFCLNSILLPPNYAHCISNVIQWGCCGAILSLGVYGSIVLKMGMLPMLLSAVAVMKANSTCKQNHLALQ